MKRKLLLLTALVVSALTGMRAQTDVTSTYLKNPGFENGVDNWTYGGSGTNYSGVAAYGSTDKFNNITNVSVDKFGNSKGSAVHNSAGWGSPSFYTQEVTLPAGSYKITFDVINRRNTNGGSSRMGWVPNSGDAVYSQQQFSYNIWSTHSVEFTLDQETTGKISVGMVSVSGSGSGSAVCLFTDNVKIYKMDAASDISISKPLDYSDLINQYSWNCYEEDASAVSTISSATDNVNKGDWPYRNIERYRGYGGHYGKKLFQTVNVPAGVYQVQAACMSAAANGVEGDNALPDGTLDNAYFYANNEEITYPLANATSSFQTLLVTLEEEGQIEFGVKTVAAGANWNSIGCATLLKLADNYSAYVADLLAVNYEELKTQIDLANNIKDKEMDSEVLEELTSKLNIAETTYNEHSATTVEDIDEIKSNLISAIENANISIAKYTTYNTAVSTINGGTNVNLSSLIKNNGFEQGNMTGWTNSGAQQASAQGNKAFDNTQDNYYAERWHADGTVDVNQTISYLPAGIYEVSAYLYTDAGDGKLYVNETEVPFSTSNKYTAVVEIDDKASIILGAKCTLTGSTWICMDEFTMTYIGTADDLQYTLTEGKMGTDKRAAQTTAETTFNKDKTLDNYNALLVAISEAEVSVKNYENLKAAIDKANEIKEANNVVTAEALSQFEHVIEEATTGWTNETYTNAECLNEITVLGTSVSGWHGNANGAAGKYIASAWDGGTDTWNSYYINTWSIEGDNDGTNFSVPFFEYYTGNTNNLGDKDMTATIPVENGGYEVEAWVRIEERTDAAINSNSAEKLTMTVNGGTPVTLIGEKIGNSRMYIGRFSAVGEVTDGNLVVKISVKNASNVHWFCFRDVKYKKIDGVSMSVKAGKYGTFIAPFDVTLPDGVKAYKVNEMEEDGITVKLEEVAATISANTPVVLENTTEENFTKDFFGKSTATENTYTVGLLTGVYNNSAEKPYVIPASDATTTNYVLQTQPAGQAFYIVKEAYSMKTPNRAYLSVPAASGTEGAVKAIFFPGQGDATGINTVSTLLGGDVEGIYTVGGAKVNNLQKGVNIIRTADGKTTKVLVK